MPCYDSRVDEERAQVASALCGAIRAAGGIDAFLKGAPIDFAAAGITEEWLRQWWREHERIDAGRNLVADYFKKKNGS